MLDKNLLKKPKRNTSMLQNKAGVFMTNYKIMIIEDDSLIEMN